MFVTFYKILSCGLAIILRNLPAAPILQSQLPYLQGVTVRRSFSIPTHGHDRGLTRSLITGLARDVLLKRVLPNSGLPSRGSVIRRRKIDHAIIHRTVSGLRTSKLIRAQRNVNAFIVRHTTRRNLQLGISATLNIHDVLRLHVNLRARTTTLTTDHHASTRLRRVHRTLSSCRGLLTGGSDYIRTSEHFRLLVTRTANGIYFDRVVRRLNDTVVPQAQIGTTRHNTTSLDGLKRLTGRRRRTVLGTVGHRSPSTTHTTV